MRLGLKAEMKERDAGTVSLFITMVFVPYQRYIRIVESDF